MMQNRMLPFVLLVALICGGCSTPWVNAHRGLTAAHAVNHAAYQALNGVRDDIVGQTRESLIHEYEQAMVSYAACRTTSDDCEDPGTPDEWMSRWEEDIADFRNAEDAMYTVDGAIVAASRAVVEWSETHGDSTPENLRVACSTIGEAFPVVLRALQRFEVDYPEELNIVSAFLAPVCQWSVDFISGLVGGEE
jgi:hypothetical protein